MPLRGGVRSPDGAARDMQAPVENESPTFRRPQGRRDNVAGRLVVKFAPEALASAAAIPTRAGVRARLDRVPDAVEQPLSYLRANAGLRSVEPLFAKTRVGEQRPADRDRLAAIASVRDVDEIGEGFAVLELPEAKIDKTLLKRIGSSPAVELIEPLPLRWLLGGADPKANLQWGLPAIRYFQAKRPAAARVRVGVLDSGIDATHRDLPKVGIHDTGGGSARDPIGHGTHVAGVIAALANNGIGITGICDCELNVWKIFPDGDEYVDPVAYYRALRAVAAEGIDVVNLSIGGTAHNQAEVDLFASAVKRGVTFVAAMGNEYEEGNETSYPAAYDDVISVGAVDQARRRSSFSNTGGHIDLCAPGSDILSTLPMQTAAGRSETRYGSWSGTSMATPHVAAAAALLKARRPGRTPAQIAKRLRRTAAGLPEMAGAASTEEHGCGLLNLRAALAS